MREDKRHKPAPGQEHEEERRGHDDHKKKKKRRRKKKHHFFFWILLLILIIGILLGILIDQGIIGFPGGKGWIGGAIGSITNQGQQDPTTAPSPSITNEASPLPTNEPVVVASELYIRVSENKIFINDCEITDLQSIVDQLNTDTYKNCAVYLTDDYATKAVYDQVKAFLEEKNIAYTEKLTKE